MLDLTLRELIQLRGSKDKAKKAIRTMSRRVYNASDKPKHCDNCGCDDCYEVHHIKPIASFVLDSPVSDIVSLENLQALCPTCHALEHLNSDTYITVR